MTKRFVIVCVLLLCIIVSCGLKGKEELQFIDSLGNVINPSQLKGNNLIILISENNCSSCALESLKKRMDTVSKRNMIMGIIFRQKEFNSSIESLKKETHSQIQWYETNNIDLMRQISKITGESSGPYWITIKAGNIEKIEVH